VNIDQRILYNKTSEVRERKNDENSFLLFDGIEFIISVFGWSPVSTRSTVISD